MNAFRNLDLAEVASKLRINTLNVQDFEMVTPSIARVIVTMTGTQPNRENLRAELASLFKGLASPIADSFRPLTNSGTIASLVGFIKTSSEVKAMETIDPSKFKAMASNLMMDEADKSLWEVRSGNAGKYLVKQGEEDLSELATSLHSHKSGLPTFAHVATASAEPKEFAAYVDLKMEEVQHGYVIETAAEGEAIKVLAFSDDGAEIIDVQPNQLIEVVNLDGEDIKHTGIEMAAGPMDKAAMIEYYKKAYSYSPEYIQKVIDTINQHAFA